MPIILDNEIINIIFLTALFIYRVTANEIFFSNLYRVNVYFLNRKIFTGLMVMGDCDDIIILYSKKLN